MAGEAVDDLGERPVKKDFAVVDDENAMTKLFDVLHIMTGQERHDAVFLIVDAQKFTDTLVSELLARLRSADWKPQGNSEGELAVNGLRATNDAN